MILTAGFGDGHNSAARSIAAALKQESGGRVKAVVADLFQDAAPVTGRFYKWLYHQAINYFPMGWSWFFKRTAQGHFESVWWDRFVGLRRAMESRLKATQSQVLVLTYPVYPYFLPDLSPDALRPESVFMVVTDSISIHPIWLKGKVDRLFVTDELSLKVAEAGVAAGERVEVSGFPVSPVFAKFPPRRIQGPENGLRVLYFATTAKRHVRATLEGLLRHLPPASQVTVAMGRHEKRLSVAVERIRQSFPEASVTAIGWTKEVPDLLRRHDVVISKAGGATVHECFAAGVPVLVNYVIPGQEEGNVELLERLGCGCRAPEASETGPLLAALVADGRLAAMQAAMLRHRRPDGALRLAREVLAELQRLKKP
ncbi:MAG: hypothetical protein EOP86_18425 [Verrucomicrobiaceae bacterium]|nr:MAG: hypothetical protein EOP86_18425 [Verrucomicrobiaceae bacterium]